MDFGSIPLFTTMKAKLGYMSERQGIYAQNIANADTPGYQAKDVSEPDFKRLMHGAGGGKLRLQATNGNHIVHAGHGGSQFKVIKRDSTYELNPMGNNVSIEEEMSKVAENQAEYQKVLNLYRKTVDMFKTAIGKPNG